MDISNLNKSEILAALFNNSKSLGMGFLHYKPDHVMTTEEAEGLLAQSEYFDYLEGRVMKIKLEGDAFDTFLYNRDNGDGAAERIIAALGV